MSRSFNDHRKNYNVVIGSRNFKNQTKQKSRAILKQAVRDVERSVDDADVIIAQAEATAFFKKDIWFYD